MGPSAYKYSNEDLELMTAASDDKWLFIKLQRSRADLVLLAMDDNFIKQAREILSRC